MTANSLVTGKARESLSYKQSHKGERKPGVKFFLGRKRKTLFWSDLHDVEYDPDAVEVVSEGEEVCSPSVEKIVLAFTRCTVTIKGYHLGYLDNDAQEHRIDFIRLSSKETILSQGNATDGDDHSPVVLSIKIEKVEKAKPKEKGT